MRNYIISPGVRDLAAAGGERGGIWGQGGGGWMMAVTLIYTVNT